MEKVHKRANTVVVVVAVAVVLWVSTHRAIDFFAPGASAQLANHNIGRMLPAVAVANFDLDGDVDGDDFLRIRGRVIVDEASRLVGDYNGNGFDILSFRHGLARSADRRSPVFGDVIVTKEIDSSSTKLAEAVAEGLIIPSLEIHLTASYAVAAPQTYLRYELKNVRPSRYDIGGSGQSGGRPTEEVAFNFEEVKVTYTEYDESGLPRGETEFSWKVEKGE